MVSSPSSKDVNLTKIYSFDIVSNPGFKDAKIVDKYIDWVDFFEDLGYTFIVETHFWTHESLYDVYKLKEKWYYDNPKKRIEIESYTHFHNIIRSHKLKKLLNVNKNKC